MIKKFKVITVVGARPNFIKFAPFIHALESVKEDLKQRNMAVEHILVHTGQHFDRNMSDNFFNELKMPHPDYNLGVGSGSHAYQAGQTMIEFEKVLLKEMPDWVIVLGDVNATAACSFIAKKYNVKVAHVEAGLRSNDWTMPEEINRIVTDRLSDLLFTTCRFSDANLKSEGVSDDKIVRVGNIMIDTLEIFREQAAVLNLFDLIQNNLWNDSEHQASPRAALTKWDRALRGGQFVALTLHRPSNVDDPETLSRIMRVVLQIANDYPVIFPIHPRTSGRLKASGLWNELVESSNIILTQPITYLEMLYLNMNARIVLTDSGGIQDETCVLGTPCLTLRWNTERPMTLIENGGTSRLVGNDPDLILKTFKQVIEQKQDSKRPESWDGHTAERIVKGLVDRL